MNYAYMVKLGEATISSPFEIDIFYHRNQLYRKTKTDNGWVFKVESRRAWMDND